ncbi:hypothetical protein, partial [Escherichia coli]|uniref:hypothetical protein n=1 Tax=Escherichia coli TaxID=562 RepID=UPI0020BFAB9E
MRNAIRKCPVVKAAEVQFWAPKGPRQFDPQDTPRMCSVTASCRAGATLAWSDPEPDLHRTGACLPCRSPCLG